MRVFEKVFGLFFLLLFVMACPTDTPVDDNGNDADVGGGQDVQGEDVSGDLDAVVDTGSDDAASDDDASDEDVAEADGDTGEDTDDGGAEDVGDVGTDDSGNGEIGLEGDTCESAIDVTDGGSWQGESTAEMNDNYDPVMSEDNCPGTDHSDRERVYVVSPQETTTYQVVADPEDGFDLMIYVRDDCDADACLAGTRLNLAGQAESLTFDAQGGMSTFIFVDGEPGHWGEFDLEVTVED